MDRIPCMVSDSSLMWHLLTACWPAAKLIEPTDFFKHWCHSVQHTQTNVLSELIQLCTDSQFVLFCKRTHNVSDDSMTDLVSWNEHGSYVRSRIWNANEGVNMSLQHLWIPLMNKETLVKWNWYWKLINIQITDCSWMKPQTNEYELNMPTKLIHRKLYCKWKRNHWFSMYCFFHTFQIVMSCGNFYYTSTYHLPFEYLETFWKILDIVKSQRTK